MRINRQKIAWPIRSCYQSYLHTLSLKSRQAKDFQVWKMESDKYIKYSIEVEKKVILTTIILCIYLTIYGSDNFFFFLLFVWYALASNWIELNYRLPVALMDIKTWLE